jgi:toxin ParE1/3/4
VPTLRRHPQAEQDLIEIYQHISRDNPPAAEKLVRAVNAKCETLARSPMIGRARPELREELRSFPYGAYLILYRIIDDGVEIVRVVHAARNLDDLV